jgi:hypothetical protein
MPAVDRIEALRSEIATANSAAGMAQQAILTDGGQPSESEGLLINATFVLAHAALELLAEIEKLRDDIASLGHWDCANCEHCIGVDDEGMCTRCGGQAEWWEPDTSTKLRATAEEYHRWMRDARDRADAAEAERDAARADVARLTSELALLRDKAIDWEAWQAALTEARREREEMADEYTDLLRRYEAIVPPTARAAGKRKDVATDG